MLSVMTLEKMAAEERLRRLAHDKHTKALLESYRDEVARLRTTMRNDRLLADKRYYVGCATGFVVGAVLAIILCKLVW